MPTYDAGSARLSIVPDAREFRNKLEAELRKIQVDYAVKISADLAKARAEIDKFRAEQEGRTVKLRAEVDRDHLRSAFADVRRDFEAVGGSLGKALKIDAATVGIDLLPALAAGLVSVAQALEQVADAGLAVPGILAGVGASVGAVALGISGIKDAWTDAGKVSSQSGADMARQAQQVTSATNSLRNAVVDEANAQKDVADARKEARQQLEDLNIQLRGGALSEKEALLEAAKARRDLATGRHKDALDYQEAQLRVEEADQRVVEAHQHNIEIQQKVSDANAKGVEGSDRVVAANERLVRSHQSVQAASASLANVGAGGAVDKAAEAMAKLAPNAREFVQAMLDLKPAFKDFQQGVQNNIFDGLAGSLKKLVASDLPGLRTGFGNIAKALNSDFKQLFASLGSDSSRGLLDRILGNTANADARVKGAIDPLVHAFGTLSAVGSDSLPRLADAFDHVADRFDHFISAAAADGRLAKWISDGETAFTHLGDIAINLGKTFHGITSALGGEGMLAALDRVTGKMSAFVNSAAGQEKLTKFFQDARAEFENWKPVIENLAKLLPEVFAAAKQNADEFLPVIKNVTDTLAKNPEIVKQILDGFLLWETVIKPITNVSKAIVDLTKTYEALKLIINGTRDAAVLANAAMAATGGAGGAGPAARLGLGAGSAIPIIGGGLAAGAAAAAVESQIDKNSVPLGGDPKLLGSQLNLTEADVAKLTVPQGAPKPGSPAAEGAMSQGALRGNKAEQWVVSTQNKWDQAARYAWLMNHPGEDKNPNFTPPSEYVKNNKPTPGIGVGGGPGGFDFGPAGYAAGGGTPMSPGPLPDGGYHAVVHPSEYVANRTGRAALGDAFLSAANKGVVDPSLLPHFDAGGPGGYQSEPIQPYKNADPGDFSHTGQFNPRIKIDTSHASSSGPPLWPPPMDMPHFDDGGPGDIHHDPGNVMFAPPNPATLGPQTIAPNPTAGGGGLLNQVIGGIASGASGPIGNAIGLIQGISGAGGKGGSGGGGGMIPGIWGLMQAGGNQDALAAWGSQTANWTANFAAKTLSSGAQTLLQGGLDAIGLGGSILSPTNPYNQAIQKKTAGFYLGSDSPLSKLGAGGQGADLSGAGIGAQSLTLGDGSTIQIPTYGTSQGGGSPTGLGPGAQAAINYAYTHALGQKYAYGGIGPNYDCSGIASAVYAAAKGLPQGTRYFTTESDFASLGFVPGYQPGALNIGVMRGGGGMNSHMALTLPNGVNVESGGASDSTQYGGGAAGAKSFPLQWHLILPGNMPAPGGIPGLPPTLYDEGGLLPVGLTVASNQTGKPEAVITQQQTQALQAVAQHVETQTKPTTQVPDAAHLQTPQPSTAATPVPSPGGATPAVPAPTPTGGTPLPSLAAPAVAPAPSNLDHNLAAINTGIDSGASAIGQAVSTAIGIAAAGASASGFGAGAAGAIGAIGPYAAGLIKEGGKVTKDVVNIGSSFLVGNVTGGTQDLAYGSQLKPAQNTPNVAVSPNVTNYNIQGNYELRAAQEAYELQQAQNQQAALANHGRISP